LQRACGQRVEGCVCRIGNLAFGIVRQQDEQRKLLVGARRQRAFSRHQPHVAGNLSTAEKVDEW
jgi:hypothetical protein